MYILILSYFAFEEFFLWHDSCLARVLFFCTLRLTHTHTHFVPGVVRDVKKISLNHNTYHSAIYVHIKMSRYFKKIRIVKKKKYFIV